MSSPQSAAAESISSSTSGSQQRHFYLDGNSLTPDDVVDIGHCHPTPYVDLTPAAWEAVRKGRAMVDSVLERKEIAYGINTGFGNFANVIIPETELSQLQCNLIRSHAAGVGFPLSPSKTRMLLTLRINVLAKGHSGIREETVKKMLAALNSNCLPYVPCKGTVGASGDLAPLSHLALGMMGEGKMWDPATKTYEQAKDVLQKYGLTPITLQAKEGLALINGTQLITSVGAEAVTRARRVALQADVVAAMTLEALKASARPFNPVIHAVRAHRGQGAVAGRMRAMLNYGGEPSEIMVSHQGCGKVQDSYTCRCIPQIHGITHDTVSFAYDILAVECNSATDNPMIFADEPAEKVMAHQYQDEINEIQKQGRTGFIISGGNFHGEYPSKALDYLTIGIHEIASVSERRIERLVNPALSGLPAFLVEKGGLNSGFMIAHCTAAALVSENKTLCHPASVDSLSTSAAQEDHVSMGGFAARKSLKVVSHVEMCIAIELLCACQAIDFLRPLKTTEPLERVHALVRSVVKPWDTDRFMAPDIEACVELIRTGKVWDAVKQFIPEQYHM